MLQRWKLTYTVDRGRDQEEILSTNTMGMALTLLRMVVGARYTNPVDIMILRAEPVLEDCNPEEDC